VIDSPNSCFPGMTLARLNWPRRANQAGGPATRHGDLFPALRGPDEQPRFAPGARIDHAAHRLADEVMVQAGLIAGDADVDTGAIALLRLRRELGVGEQRARERHHVRVAARQDLFRDFRSIDAVRGDHRNAHRLPQAARGPGEGGAWHSLRDRRYASLVPADAAIEQTGAGRLHTARHIQDLVGGETAFDELQRRDAIDDDEVAPGRLPRPTHDLRGKAHALG
jgi:hypothetical protein